MRLAAKMNERAPLFESATTVVTETAAALEWSATACALAVFDGRDLAVGDVHIVEETDDTPNKFHEQPYQPDEGENGDNTNNVVNNFHGLYLVRGEEPCQTARIQFKLSTHYYTIF
ncbi:MAG: hypothetical protein K0S38_595 [Candidatus Paceibacter sp.]|nr:hypothetical protein [Candidatus Paceibacter sp.]